MEGAARVDLLEPQVKVGSLTIDPDLPLYGGLIFVAVLNERSHGVSYARANMPTSGSNPRGSNAVRSSVARAKGKLNDELSEPAATNSTPDRAAV